MGMSTGNQGNSSGGPRSPLVEINVTPFVDVMLVLLIIFMISAPMMEQGVPIQLPSTKGQPLDHKTQPVVVSIDPKGVIFIGKSPSNLTTLGASLKRLAKQNDPVYVRADQEVAYGTVAKVMGVLKNSGFTQVGLVTIPESR